MQKILLAVALVTGLVTTIAAQNLRFTPVVKPTQGGSSRVGNYQLDYTIGEPSQKTLRNGNLVFIEGFEQNEEPLPPLITSHQTFFTDTDFTFKFINIRAGAGGNQIEWATNPYFISSTIDSSGCTALVKVPKGILDTIWVRTRLNGVGLVSKAITKSMEADQFGLVTDCVIEGDESRSASCGAGSGCTTNSPYFTTTQSHYTFQNDLRFLSNSNTAIKKIALNFIFLRKNDGTCGIDTSIAEQAKYIDDAIDWMRDCFNGGEPEVSGPVYCFDTTMPVSIDSKIDFVINKYFINDSIYWNNNNSWSLSYLGPLDANITSDTAYAKGINFYFTEFNDYWQTFQSSTGPIAAGIYGKSSSMISSCNLATPLRINMINKLAGFENSKRSDSDFPGTWFNPYLPYNDSNRYYWVVGGLGRLLAHEIGHCLFNDGHHLNDDISGTWMCANNLMNNQGGGNRQYFRSTDLAEMHQALSWWTVREYIVGCPYSPYDPYVVSNNELIDYDFKTWRDIVVDSGATLTVTCTVRMPNKGKIIVKPGGKLIVNGGTITNACDSLWEGIIAQGNKLLPQDMTDTIDVVAISSNQSFIYLKDAIIENANIAVRAWNLADGWVSSDPTSPQGGTGAIVRAVNTTFRNVNEAAAFPSYHASGPNGEINNKSYFAVCHFETNDNAPESLKPYSFITNWDTRGIRFWGCDFSNNSTITSSTNDYELGSGIVAMDASMTVTDYDPSISLFGSNLVHSSFTKLQHGVHVMTNYGVGDLVKVYDARFNNCLRGIRNEGIGLCEFVGNNFIMGNNPAAVTAPASTPTHYDEGIILHSEMAGFIVEQNRFDRTTEGIFRSYGIRVAQTGGNENRIYNNLFDSMSVGNLANMQNQMIDGSNIPYGLTYNCNTNYANVWYDIVSQSDTFYLNAGIKKTQGFLNQSAGNKFSHNNEFTNVSDFFSDELGVNYYQTGFVSNGNIYCPYYNLNLSLFVISNTFENECPANYQLPEDDDDPPGHCIGCPSNSGYAGLHSDHNGKYNWYKAVYDALIDGGNTQARLYLVDTSTNAIRMRDTLLLFAPNLSTEVLLAVVNKSVADTIKYKILKYNAEAVTPEVMNEWVGIVAPVPQWMRDSINAARGNLTYRSYLLDTLTYHSSEKQRAIYGMLHTIADDTAGFNLAVYRIWLDSADGVWAKHQMVNSYLEEYRFDTIEALLAHYDTIINTNVADSIQFQTYKEHVRVYKDWMIADSSIMHLDSANLAELHTLADGYIHQKGTHMAHNAVNFFYGGSYFVPPYLREETVDKKENEEEPLIKPETKVAQIRPATNPVVNLYPNPAQNQLTIEYGNIGNTAWLSIVDIMGKVVETRLLTDVNGKVQINTTLYQNGVYLARIETANSVLLKGKFVILK